MPIYIVISEYVNQYPYTQMGVKRMIKVFQTTFENASKIDLSEYYAKNIPIAVDWYTREPANPIKEFSNGN